MSSTEYKNISTKSRYPQLINTWCGQGIPSEPFKTYNPPFHAPNTCPSNWNEFRVPNEHNQIMVETQPINYSTLTHNSPYTNSNYFNYNPAYPCNKNNRYKTIIRGCDNNLKK